jgi:hypothetical protein
MGKEGKDMDMVDFVDLVEEIMKNHSWFTGIKGKGIKYIHPHFDTRTGKFHAITFSTMEGDKTFAVVNENRHRNLREWITEWLNS